jgi:branched-chain amino acid transport system permease protein
MPQFVQFVYTGLVIGAVMATMGMGLALVWGGLRMLNMAHGALIMVGAYIAHYLTDSAGLPVLAALVVTVAGVSALGALMYPAIIRPLIGRPGWDVNVIIATVALSLALTQLMQLVFGPKSKSLPAIVTGGFTGPAGVHIAYQLLLVGVVALASLAGLGAFLGRSRHGIALRAVAQNLDGARLMGLHVGRVYVMILALSAGLAALSGVLLVATGTLFITPTMGAVPMLQSLMIVVLGGLGSIKGTVVAAVVAGLTVSGAQTYVSTEWSLPVLFLVVVLLLLVRPSGFFGRQERLA